MGSERVVCGLDIGTTKICALSAGGRMTRKTKSSESEQRHQKGLKKAS